jgi:hypothetical protein
MTLGEIVELIIGFAILGFMLVFIIIVPIQILNQPKRRTTRRRTRKSYKSKSSFNSYGPKDFDYYHNHNKLNFFVYFIENEDLGALKIGVGSGGRLLQLLNSYQDKNELSSNIGWKLLRLAVFADFENEYELGKIYAEQAEKKAHYYWRNVLHLPIHLTPLQMGYSKVKNYGEVNWTLTKGYTETVEKGKVCEVSTWNYVINSYGFIEENNAFMGSQPRELNLLHQNHSALNEPLEYEAFTLKQVRHFFNNELSPKDKKSMEERFWERVDKKFDDCWMWTGAATSKDESRAYGLFNYDGKLELTHRLAWVLEGKEDIENSTLENRCGHKKCVKTDHWGVSLRSKNNFGEKRVSTFQCTSEGCERPSETFTKATLCEPCRQKVKRIRRKKRNQFSVENYSSLQDKDLINLNPISIKMIGKISVYRCISEGCTWPSSSMFESAYCEICKKKRAKRQDK